MVSAYWQQPLLQDDVALWLGATGIGVPASRIQLLTRRGWNIVYRTGSLQDLVEWLGIETPCILFVRTGDLPYWKLDTPHAIVIGAIENDSAQVFDPAMQSFPISVSIGNLLLAWSHFDYAYAVLNPLT